MCSWDESYHKNARRGAPLTSSPDRDPNISESSSAFIRKNNQVEDTGQYQKGVQQDSN